jgi:hypothetical protein
MVRVYIASRMRNRSHCREVAQALTEAGHYVTARWVEEPSRSIPFTDIATRDLKDVRRADVIMLIGHNGRNGGCMTEWGVALERGLRMIHVAAEPGENVFTHTPGVEYFRTYVEAIDALDRRKREVA